MDNVEHPRQRRSEKRSISTCHQIMSQKTASMSRLLDDGTLPITFSRSALRIRLATSDRREFLCYSFALPSRMARERRSATSIHNGKSISDTIQYGNFLRSRKIYLIPRRQKVLTQDFNKNDIFGI
ncbi:hypothetical protein Tcan_10494 [Toxocara canis]|uniref:Uncharacterized protein n=1 Tax=Toxocara canis TaxID=6265 RepID=A0A0B2V6C2_TOXCA|nr:hypothetical protein Tcan_10494 [Toxocara canis]